MILLTNRSVSIFFSHNFEGQGTKASDCDEIQMLLNLQKKQDCLLSYQQH
jgi:hypothetical protein